jgi:ATP sulfurylase
MDLDSMATEELKLMMLRVGVTPQKQMKRPEVIKAIRLKLEEIDIADDDGSDA